MTIAAPPRADEGKRDVLSEDGQRPAVEAVDRRSGRSKAEHEQLVDLDPQRAAKSAGLRYVSDVTPGIRRKRAGKSFSYMAPDGRIVRDGETLRRIRSIVIPPAWTEVWICPREDGHLQ